MATANSRQRHPAAGPQAEARDRLLGIVRASRQMAAARAHQPRQRVLIGSDQAAPEQARGLLCSAMERSWLHNRCAVFRNDDYFAAAVGVRLFSICPMASTTASNVSKVEAWRAL